MRFIISSGILSKQLSSIAKVVPNNPLLPIIENFLFEVEDGKITVTATDLQVTMAIEIEVGAAEPGSVAIPAKMLLETLRNLPEQPITISIDPETYVVEIVSDKGRYKIAGENAEDFPKTPTVQNGITVTATTELVSSAIAYTLFATSTDEMKPALTGVNVILSSEMLTFAATDKHRLVRYRRKGIANSQETSLILPKKALEALRSSFPSQSTELILEFNTSNAFFTFGNLKMNCRLIDERFPDFERAIPLNNNNILTVNRNELIGSLKRLSIYSNKSTNLVRFKVSGANLQLLAEDVDFSNEATENLICEHDGEDIEIGFNAKFLQEMAGALDSDSVTFSFADSSKGAILLPTSNTDTEDILMLVMPVMLGNAY